MKMDKQINKAITEFWSDLRGVTTEEFYNEYLRQCAIANAEPRTKSVVIREACSAQGFDLVIKRKQIEVRTFETRVEK